MKSIRLMLLALAIGFSINCNAVTLKEVPSCKVWLNALETSRQINQPTWGGIIYVSWLYGYLSGVSHVSDKDFLKGIDSDFIRIWMDKYCQKNPLNDVDDGGDELAHELLKRMK